MLLKDTIVVSAKPSRPHLNSRLAERILRKKAQLDGYRPLPHDTIQRLNADLRVFLTYHSNAIEGNSLTLQETQMVIDYGITVHGHPLREYLEATNHAAAYSYITDLVEKRYIHSLNTANAGQHTPLLNLLAQSVEAGLDLYLESCATTSTSDYQPLAQLEGIGGYKLEYLSWLARQGRLDAVKRNGRWYSTRAAIEQYKTEAEEGRLKRGRPSSHSEKEDL